MRDNQGQEIERQNRDLASFLARPVTYEASTEQIRMDGGHEGNGGIGHASI